MPGDKLLVDLIMILLYTNVTYSTTPGNCDNIKYITIEDPRRSTAFDVRNTSHVDNMLCDRFVIKDNSWYRFSSVAGDGLANSPPDFHRCGTFSPIWMNGSHPTIEQGKVIREACIKIPHRLPINCGESFSISVLNCSGYYIYQLKEPEQCNAAYCAGSKKPNCTKVRNGTACPANIPPYFQMANKTFYVIENQRLDLKIYARDPEAQELIFSVLSNGTIKSSSISAVGQLTLVTNKSGKVYIKVKDDRGDYSILPLQIVTRPCPCKNSGKCVFGKSARNPPNSLNFSCQCTEARTGELCEIGTSCDNFPCFPGLQCTETKDHFMCEKCPVMFEGDGTTCKPNARAVKNSVEAEMTIVNGILWKNELKNKTSLYFKKTTARITNEIKIIYRDVEQFLYIIITGYREGSVVVEFTLVFSKQVHEPLEYFEKYIKEHGKLGDMVVDQKSLKKQEGHSTHTNQKKYLGMQKSIFVVVIVVILVLAISLLVAVAVIIRKKKISILVLRLDDTGDNICPNPSLGGSSSSVRKPSRNQIVDIASVENKVFVDYQEKG